MIKRDDLIHPIISGNKWRKLSEYIRLAIENKTLSMISFGGAYSNHLYSLAFVGKSFGIKTIGIVRGDELTVNSNPYLQQMAEWGMELQFISRHSYALKIIPESIEQANTLIINEGGFGEHGIRGLKAMADELKKIKFDTLICAVGTGTTLIGLQKFMPQKTLGILTLNNENEIHTNGKVNECSLDLNATYIFGKYAKQAEELTNFCDEFMLKHQIKIEPIYTGRMFYGLYDLIRTDYFEKGSTILALHTGGIKLTH